MIQPAIPRTLTAASTIARSAGTLLAIPILSNLAAGQYCIGLAATSANDPAYALTFNTPVNGFKTPEPSGFVLARHRLGDGVDTHGY
jgi:hypothetical protein